MRTRSSLKRPKRRRCKRCKTSFAVNPKGRAPLYCSQVCRQRSYEDRRIQSRIPMYLLDRDIDDIRSKDGIKKVVVDVLRELGLMPMPDKSPRPALRLVFSNDDKE